MIRRIFPKTTAQKDKIENYYIDESEIDINDDESEMNINDDEINNKHKQNSYKYKFLDSDEENYNTDNNKYDLFISSEEEIYNKTINK